MKQYLEDKSERIHSDIAGTVGYWRSLGQNAQEHTETMELTEAVQRLESKCSAVAQSVSTLSPTLFARIIKSKPHWKAPGPDKI
ncbi:hypothetical protein, partial [Acinetobacter baumannii]|uniref:hypothetical protein n=1 Tax=Acinetobacter baumannii TaxID=470 RepID=UPI0033925C5D